MSSPQAHEHQGKTCPISSHKHTFCPPQQSDSRSVCPALNTMANHGYISRDGKNLSAQELTDGLMECYGLSKPLSYILGYVGFALLGKIGLWQHASLFEFGKHNVIEHNASLVHRDISEGEIYAPTEVDAKLVDALSGDIRPAEKAKDSGFESPSKNGERVLMDFEDFARSRIRREKEAGPIDLLHRDLARGEIALMSGVLGIETSTKTGIPMDYLRCWLGEERLPDGWKPTHTQGLMDVLKRTRQMTAAVDKVKQEEKEK